MSSLLYVDDNEDNVLLVRQLLRLRSHVELQVATTGSDGFAMAGTTAPNMILLDQRLPDTLGTDLLARLQRSPATASIPVVLFSADPEVAARGAALGAAGFIPKPFEMAQLFELVDRYCVGPT